MDSFPNIRAPKSISFGLNDPFLEDEFETGDTAARPEFTVSREKPMQLTWPAMTPADLATLKTFYAAHRGPRFLWTEPGPGGGEATVCRFVSNCLNWTKSTEAYGHYSVTLTMVRII